MIERRARLHFVFSESRRLWRRIGIVRRAFDAASSRPETCTAHLVRIRFGRHRISARPWWRHTAAESSYSQVEASPEEMNRACLSDKSRAKLLKYGVAPQQYSPKSTHGICIVRSVNLILLKANGIGKFNRHRVDVGIDT